MAEGKLLSEEVRAALKERELAIVADLGGRDNMSQLKADMVQRYIAASTVADYLEHNIITQGVLSAKGRTRAAVSTYLQVLDRLHRFAGSIGLERKPKPAASLADILAKHEDGGIPPVQT